MSSELYDKFVKNNRIDQTIYESEKGMESGGVSIGLDEAFLRPWKNKWMKRKIGVIFSAWKMTPIFLISEASR